MPPETPLSLEGLAAIFARHIEHTGRRFDDLSGHLDRHIEHTSHRFAELTGQVESLVGLMREQGLRITTLAEQQAEQQLQIREEQLQIRQILHRLEQHDARFEEQSRQINEHSVFIRQMLDLLRRRGGDGTSQT